MYNKWGRNTKKLNVNMGKIFSRRQLGKQNLFPRADQFDAPKYLLFVNQIRCSTEGMKKGTF